MVPDTGKRTELPLLIYFLIYLLFIKVSAHTPHPPLRQDCRHFLRILIHFTGNQQIFILPHFIEHGSHIVMKPYTIKLQN